MNRNETGIYSLAFAAKQLGAYADVRQMKHVFAYEAGEISTSGLLRAAAGLGLKSRLLEGLSAERLQDCPLPLIMRMKQGNYIVLAALADQQMLIVDPRVGSRPMAANPQKVLDDFTGEGILIAKRFLLPKEDGAFGFSWFYNSAKKYGRFFRSVLVVSFLMQLLGLAAPFFTQVIIDKVLVHRSSNTLNVLMMGMMLSALFQHWMGALRNYIFTNVTSKIDAVLHSQAFRTITHLPRRYFDAWQSGEVTARIGELEKIRQFMTGSSIMIVLDIVFAVIYICILVFYSWVLSLTVFVILPLFVLLNIFAAPIYKRRIDERFKLGARIQAFLIETITGVAAVKSGAVEWNFVRRYEEMLARFVQSSFSVAQVANYAGCISHFLQQIFTLSILWIGALLVLDHKLTVGELISFKMIAGLLVAPIMRLVDAWQYFQQVRVSAARLGDVMNAEKEPEFDPGKISLPEMRGQIVLDNVSFAYKADDREVLQSVNISIPAGMNVGIVGRSGSGKSTLAKLMQRIYTPDRGRILIDGMDASQMDLSWLRRQVGVVTQDSVLFSRTIAENISIMTPDATEQEIRRAAELAGAAGFIEDLPYKYETPVGERGNLLSGGQRQRIAIARTLMTRPRILIMDEATSALDYESESIIMKNMEKIAKGRTVLTIAHRLSTVRHCDAIVVVDQGKFAEAGSHEELMAQRGLYYAMYCEQEGRQM